jgi:hypothetical protein
VQVYIPTSQYADEEVQELCDIIKKLLKRMENMRQTPSFFYFSKDMRLCFRKSPCDVLHVIFREGRVPMLRQKDQFNM